MNTNNEVSVPSAALAIDGVVPEVGDEVEVTLRGRVSGVRGESTLFTAIEANGLPIPKGGGAELVDDFGSEDLTEEQLREVAGAYDRKPESFGLGGL